MSDATPADPLLRLQPNDRARLGEALRTLLDHGSILGGEGPYNDLYHWAYANHYWLEEICTLLDVHLIWENDQRLVQAIPNAGAFLLRLKLDATLVLLTLWYEFDTAVRDRGETPPIILNAEQLNDSLRTKFEPLRKSMPTQTRLVEILRLAQRKNIVRFTGDVQPARTRIEVLPTIKRVIPFQDLADWTRQANRFLIGSDSMEPATSSTNLSDEDNAED